MDAVQENLIMSSNRTKLFLDLEPQNPFLLVKVDTEPRP
jgi:hypothetical protein